VLVRGLITRTTGSSLATPSVTDGQDNRAPGGFEPGSHGH
jgi:hypothetical protein